MKTTRSLYLSAVLVGLFAPITLLNSACGGDDDDTAGAGGTAGTSAGAAGTSAGTSQAGQGGSAGANAGSAGTTGGSAGTAGTSAGAAGTGGDAGTAGTAGSAGSAACDPAADPPTGAVFIAPTGSDTTGNGSKEAPFATIANALKLGNLSAIVLAPGTYSGPFTLPANVSVQGGWLVVNGAWQRDCGDDARSKVILTSSALNTPVVTVSKAGVTLRDLTVQTKDQAAPAAADTSGESLIGVLVSGDSSTLTLTNVAVKSGQAGDGGKASEAKAGSVSTCDGVSDCADGTDGAPGEDGKNGDAATFTSSGFVPGDGKSGTTGGTGKNGKVGDNGASFICFSCKASTQATCSGGGFTVYESIGKTGSCGCGGLAGDVGAVGKGGGASIGILLGTAASLTSNNSDVSSGTGGLGSSGTLGGAVADGGTGTVGGAGDSCAVDSGDKKCAWNPSTSACQPIASVEAPSGGAAGLKGGKAGKSGKGGSGAGGPSYAVVKVGAAVYSATATTLAHGDGGKGANGAPDGASGDVGTF